MSIKNLIIQEFAQLSGELLLKVLESVRQLKESDREQTRAEVWQAYLESEQENEEVYRRLANS